LVLGFPKVDGGHGTGVAVPEVAIIVASPERLKALVAHDVYGLVAPSLKSVMAGLKVLEAHSIDDDEVARELATVEAAVSRILARFDARTLQTPVRSNLSDREVQVLKRVAAGLANKEIASQLGISRATVRNHLSHAFEKLGATNRTAAVASAIRNGLLGPQTK
jgi:DNA-binding NarL/FixJ family response regulator